MEEEFEKVDLITLLRTFKKEGLDNFIVIRKEKFQNYIPKSKIIEKIEELREKLNSDDNIRIYTIKNSYELQINVLQELLEEESYE